MRNLRVCDVGGFDDQRNCLRLDGSGLDGSGLDGSGLDGSGLGGSGLGGSGLGVFAAGRKRLLRSVPRSGRPQSNQNRLLLDRIFTVYEQKKEPRSAGRTAGLPGSRLSGAHDLCAAVYGVSHDQFLTVRGPDHGCCNLVVLENRDQATRSRELVKQIH